MRKQGKASTRSWEEKKLWEKRRKNKRKLYVEGGGPGEKANKKRCGKKSPKMPFKGGNKGRRR